MVVMPGAVRGHVRRAPIRIRLRVRGKARREAALPRRLRRNAGAVVTSAGGACALGTDAKLGCVCSEFGLPCARLRCSRRCRVVAFRVVEPVMRLRLRDVQAAVHCRGPMRHMRRAECWRLKCGVPPLRPTKCGALPPPMCGAKCGAPPPPPPRPPRGAAPPACGAARAATAARYLCGVPRWQRSASPARSPAMRPSGIRKISAWNVLHRPRPVPGGASLNFSKCLFVRRRCA